MKIQTMIKYDAAQIEKIIDKVVHLVAEEKDHEFFKGILFIVAESYRSSTDFNVFIQNLISL